MRIAQIRNLGIATAAAIGLVASVVTAAVAQDGPFTDASLRGTYAVSVITSGPNEPLINMVNHKLEYFDGDGDVVWTFLITNREGEPDPDGGRTRQLFRTLDDPSTWTHSTGTYEMLPFGGFLFYTANGSTLDGIAVQTEMIDGILTVTEYIMTTRTPQGRSGGGVGLFHGTRIADGDIVPLPPGE